MKSDLVYFPHMSQSRNDRKVRRMRKELGIEGYGIFFMLLEVLREQPEMSYPYEDVDLLADDFGTSQQKVEAVIQGYGLFVVDHQHNFFSPKFEEYLQPLLKRREKAKKAAEIRWQNERKAKQLQEQCSSNAQVLPRQYKEKKRKVKKSKGAAPVTPGAGNAELSESEKQANKLAEQLLSAICHNDPEHRYNSNKPSLKTWANDIRLMIERDNREPQKISNLIKYLFSRSDEVAGFWYDKIQSGRTLREKYDNIRQQREREQAKSIGIQPQGPTRTIKTKVHE